MLPMTKAEKSSGAGQNFRSGRTAAGCANVQGIASIEALAAQRRPFQGCLLHRSSRRRRTGIPLNEALGLALEECELYLTSCLPIVLDEAIDVGAGMSLIPCALNTDHRGQFNPLTAFKGAHRASFGHRVLGLPVLI